MARRRILVLCALTCACVASKLPPAVENAVDFCVSSRWGFSCFDASASSRGVMARAGLANLGRSVGRGALVTMGAVLARETWVTIKELQQSQGGRAHPAAALRQWLMEGPLPPATATAAAAPAGVTTGPAVEAAVAPDAVPDSVAAEPAEPTPAAEAAGAAAAEPSGCASGAEDGAGAGAGAIAEKWLAAEDVASPAPPAHATPEPASSTPAPAG
jgi:hypothetical protein